MEVQLFRLIRRTLDEQGHPTVFFVSTIWSAIWPNIQNGLLVRNRGTLIMPLGIATLIPLVVIEAVLVVVLLRVIAARERSVTPSADSRWSTRVTCELANGPSPSILSSVP